MQGVGEGWGGVERDCPPPWGEYEAVGKNSNLTFWRSDGLVELIGDSTIMDLHSHEQDGQVENEFWYYVRGEWSNDR